MSLTYPTDTLAYHLARPLVVSHDASDMPAGAVAMRITEFMKNDSTPNVKPEHEALWFYGLNHGMALLQQELHPLQPLSPQDRAFVNTYHSRIGQKAVRAFYYLLLICVRESRHLQNKSQLKSTIAAKFGEAPALFNGKIAHSGSDGAYTTFLKEPPACALGPFVESLQWIFYNGSFSSSYGGPAWGSIADVLVKFVTGEYTAEIMLDTIFTLQHNNGSCFNKGMLYGGYSSKLQMLLDIQRSGQIPEAVIEGTEVKDWVTPSLRENMQWLAQRFPGKIGSYVDWNKVHSLGSIGHYYTQLKAQQAKHGLSPAEKAAAEQAQKAKEMQEAAAKLAEEEKKQKFYEVSPGVFLPKIKRAA